MLCMCAYKRGVLSSTMEVVGAQVYATAVFVHAFLLAGLLLFVWSIDATNDAVVI